MGRELTPTELSDLLGAYALDALDGDELNQVERVCVEVINEGCGRYDLLFLHTQLVDDDLPDTLENGCQLINLLLGRGTLGPGADRS